MNAEVKEIIVCPNGMVAVCDDNGKQIPELQGKWSEKKEILLPLINSNPDIKVQGDINQPKQQWEYKK